MNSNLLLVSADTHAGAAPEDYRDYFEAEHRDLVDELIDESDAFVKRGISQDRYSAEQLEFMDGRRAIRDGGVLGAWDMKVRLAQMDAEGIAAELLNPGHQLSTLPFFSAINKPHQASVRAAGGRAYNRWLADQMKDCGDRLVGTAEAGPCLDMAATVAELRWVADHGFVSVQAPGGVADPALPPAGDAYFDPFWATCAEAGLVINVHIGHGLPQVDRAVAMAPGGPLPALTEMPGNEEDRVRARRLASSGNGLRDVMYVVRRFVWTLMLSGVLDRHPELKIAISECRADWIPDTLACLDREAERLDAGMRLKPSEYWARNFYVAPSSPRSYEIAMRDRIGVDRMLLATDYPHPEGTWPNTHAWLRTIFTGVPEAEARAIMGENAVACFGLNAAKLRTVADRIGPAPSAVLNGPAAPPELQDDFDKRSGFLVPPEQVDVAHLTQLFQRDARALQNA